MALRGTRTFILHYPGSKSVKLDEIDGDEMCYMDVVKEIIEKIGMAEFELSYMCNGKNIQITTDTELLLMWEQLKAIRGVYHLHLINPLPTQTNVIPSTLNSTLNSPINSTASISNPKSQKTTPKSKKIPGNSMATRRSPRLANKWKSKVIFKEPIEVSDNEENVDISSKVSEHLTKLAHNISILDVDDDWAVTHLIETTFDESANVSDDELLIGLETEMVD